MTIGVPCETILSEKRVALVPSSIRTLVGYGHEIIVESGAGQHANFSDHHYSEAGATISHSRETVFKSQVIVKIAPPTTEEIKLMQADQVLISHFSFPALKDDYLEHIKQKRITALAMEYLRADDDGSYPIVRIMSEIAGTSAVFSSRILNNSAKGGRGVLLGGISACHRQNRDLGCRICCRNCYKNRCAIRRIGRV